MDKGKQDCSHKTGRMWGLDSCLFSSLQPLNLFSSSLNVQPPSEYLQYFTHVLITVLTILISTEVNSAQSFVPSFFIYSTNTT